MTRPPTGMLMESSPLKVTVCSVAASRFLVPKRVSGKPQHGSGAAMVTRVIGRSVRPKAFESRMRISCPPVVISTLCRIVVFANGTVALKGGGSRSEAFTYCGAAANVSTQWLAGAGAALGSTGVASWFASYWPSQRKPSVVQRAIKANEERMKKKVLLARRCT